MAIVAADATAQTASEKIVNRAVHALAGGSHSPRNKLKCNRRGMEPILPDSGARLLGLDTRIR